MGSEVFSLATRSARLRARSTGFKEGHLSSVLPADNRDLQGLVLAREFQLKKKREREKEKESLVSARSKGASAFHVKILKTFISKSSRRLTCPESVTRLTYQLLCPLLKRLFSQKISSGASLLAAYYSIQFLRETAAKCSSQENNAMPESVARWKKTHARI